MKKELDRIRVIFALIMMLSGVMIFSYPIVSNALAQRNASIAIQQIEENMHTLDESEQEAIRAAATQYNALLRDAQERTRRGEGVSTDISYTDMLNTGAALGYITIPCIDVNLPIFEGVDEDVLVRGAGHLLETSYPIGGESTHSALSSHRGLAGAVLFTDLDRMQRGDLFFLHVLDEVLAYRVDQVLTVLPDDTSVLENVEGEDLCTLVTCTPIGINSHRLLVRGIRTEYVPEAQTENKQSFFLVGFELILLVAAWLDSMYLKKGVRCYIALPTERAEKGTGFTVDAVLENRSRLPMTEVSVELLCRDTFTGRIAGLTGIATLDCGETARIHFTLQGSHCGGWDISWGKITVADHLGLVRGTLPRQTQTQRMYLLPERKVQQPVKGGSGSAAAEEGRDGTQLQHTDEGSDYEFRPFQAGDSLKMIHWKMAAKTDELMVRSFEELIHRQKSLILEPVPAEGENVTHELWDRYLERLEELSAGLLAAGENYYVVWYEKKRSICRRILVENEDPRRWMICGVMAVPDEEGLGFGEWEDDGLEQTTEQETLRLRWRDMA